MIKIKKINLSYEQYRQLIDEYLEELKNTEANNRRGYVQLHEDGWPTDQFALIFIKDYYTNFNTNSDKGFECTITKERGVLYGIFGDGYDLYVRGIKSKETVVHIVGCDAPGDEVCPPGDRWYFYKSKSPVLYRVLNKYFNKVKRRRKNND